MDLFRQRPSDEDGYLERRDELHALRMPTASFSRTGASLRREPFPTCSDLARAMAPSNQQPAPRTCGATDGGAGSSDGGVGGGALGLQRAESARWPTRHLWEHRRRSEGRWVFLEQRRPRRKPGNVRGSPHEQLRAECTTAPGSSEFLPRRPREASFSCASFADDGRLRKARLARGPTRDGNAEPCSSGIRLGRENRRCHVGAPATPMANVGRTPKSAGERLRAARVVPPRLYTAPFEEKAEAPMGSRCSTAARPRGT